MEVRYTFWWRPELHLVEVVIHLVETGATFGGGPFYILVEDPLYIWWRPELHFCGGSIIHFCGDRNYILLELGIVTMITNTVV